MLLGEGANIVTAILILVIGLGLWVQALAFDRSNKHKRQAEEAEAEKLEHKTKQEQEAALKAKQEEEAKAIQKAFETQCAQLTEQYGPMTNAIPLSMELDVKNYIIFFEGSKQIWLCGTTIKMSEVISSELKNDARIIAGRQVQRTSTDTADMFGRAGLGMLLGGDAGQIIGGTTANKTTIIQNIPDKVINSYAILLTVDSIANPLITIYLGEDKVNAEKLQAIFTVIATRNKK